MAPMTASRGELQFTVSLADLKFAASGDPGAKGRFTMRGHAAVFNLRSHDLGGFRTEIDPAFFDEVLATDPDVHLLRDHDTRLVLGRTKNGSLTLSTDEKGLSVWAMFPKTPIADETATLLDGGFIDQMSFATDIGEDVWYEDADGTIVRRLLNSAGLFDVTVCAQGAFPQTESSLAACYTRASTDLLASAVEAGRVTTRDAALVAARGENHDVTASGPGVATVADESQGGRDIAANEELTKLQKWAETRFSAAPFPT